MNLLLKEYLSSGDISEATRCLKELDVPHFHHELVYEVIHILCRLLCLFFFFFFLFVVLKKSTHTCMETTLLRKFNQLRLLYIAGSAHGNRRID